MVVFANSWQLLEPKDKHTVAIVAERSHGTKQASRHKGVIDIGDIWCYIGDMWGIGGIYRVI